MEQDSGYGTHIGYFRSKDFRSQADRDTQQSKPIYKKQRLAAQSVPWDCGKGKRFLQNLIREKDMPPKPVLNMDMDEFRTMQTLMLKVQKQAKAIKKIQEVTLPNLRQQLAETTGIFKGKERKALEKQIQQIEAALDEKLDKLPDILTDDGYPDVQAFMKTYRKAEAIVTQYNQDLAEWEQAVKNGRKPAEKQHRPPERQSVRNRLRQLQEEGKQNAQPKQRKKSQDRDR